MTFNTWLGLQRDRQDAVGKFARAARRWQDKPKTTAADTSIDAVKVKWLDFLRGKRVLWNFGADFNTAIHEYSLKARRS